MLPAAIQEKYANVDAHEAPSIHCILTVASVDQLDDICERVATGFTVHSTQFV